MTSMPASSSSCTSCQRFSFRHPGTLVWASSSTSATSGSPVEDARRDPSPRGRRPGTRPCDAGSPRARRPVRRCVRGRGSRRTRSPRRCRGRPRRRLVRAWRRSCRHRVRRRGRCAAGPWPQDQRASVFEGDVQFHHVDARLAEHAQRAALGVLVDQAEHVVGPRDPAPRPLGAPGAGRCGARCGVETGAGGGDGVDRDRRTRVRAGCAPGSRRQPVFDRLEQLGSRVRGSSRRWRVAS